MLSVALDSWPVLAWLNGEPAGRVLLDLLRWAGGKQASKDLGTLFPVDRGVPQLVMSILNLGEVYYTLSRRVGEEIASTRVSQVRMLPVSMLPVDERTVFLAASIKSRHRLSFADAFAVATACLTNSILLTGDPEMKAVAGIQVCYIGK